MVVDKREGGGEHSRNFKLTELWKNARTDKDRLNNAENPVIEKIHVFSEKGFVDQRNDSQLQFLLYHAIHFRLRPVTVILFFPVHSLVFSLILILIKQSHYPQFCNIT